MAKIKTLYYVCGVIHAQDRVLLLRPLAYNGRPFTPFYFPGTKVEPNDKYETKKLQSAIKHKYKGEISIDTYMGASVKEFKDKRVVLKAYYCTLKQNFFFPKTKVDYRWAKLEDLETLRLEPNDLEIAQRYILFKRVYEGELVAGGHVEKEAAELNFYLDSFEYFGRQMDGKDVKDFNELMRTSATIEQLRKAYKYVMRINHLDYNAYLDYYEKKNPPKKKELFKPTTDEIDIPDKVMIDKQVKGSDFIKGKPHNPKAKKVKPNILGKNRRLTSLQITGIVLLSVALLIEAITLLIAFIPLVPSFFETTVGSLSLILSSLLLLVGVLMTFYGRKEG